MSQLALVGLTVTCPVATHQPTDSLIRIPSELIFKILQSLTFYEDIQSVSLTCKSISQLFIKEEFWSKLCASIHVITEKDFRKAFTIYSNFLNGVRKSSFIKLNGEMQFCVPVHNKLYAVIKKNPQLNSSSIVSLDLKILQHNEKIADYTDRAVISCLGTYEDMPVWGCLDGSIYMWDSSLHRIHRTQKISENEIAFIVSDPARKQIIVGDRKEKIVAWNVEAASTVLMLSDMGEQIRHMTLHQDYLLACSIVGTILCFKLSTNSLIATQNLSPSQKKDLYPVICGVHGNQVFLITSPDEDNSMFWTLDLPTLAIKETSSFPDFKLIDKTPCSNYVGCYDCIPWENQFIMKVEREEGGEKELILVNPATREVSILQHTKSIHNSMLYYEGKLIVFWGLGLKIYDYSIPQSQIKYSELEHLGLVTLKDFQERLGRKYEDLFEQLWTDQDYAELQELLKPQSKIAPLPLLAQDEAHTNIEIQRRNQLSQRLAELKQGMPPLLGSSSSYQAVTEKSFDQVQTLIETSEVLNLDIYKLIVDCLNSITTELNKNWQLDALRDFLKRFYNDSEPDTRDDQDQ